MTVIKFKVRQYSKQYYSEWKTLDYTKPKGHINHNKYIYKIGHKLYQGPNKELRDIYKHEVGKLKTWAEISG